MSRESRHAQLQVFTIGHSSHPLHTFIWLLRRHGVESLVDIRRFPGSKRHPHFSRENLSSSLAEEDTEYHWLESLGGRRKKSKETSPNQGLRNQGFRNYADYMGTDEFQAGVANLVEIAGRHRTTIMCAEGNRRLAPGGANQNGKGKAAEIAARLAKASARQVERVKELSKQAPELVDKIRTGELNIAEAKRLATISSQRTAEQKARRRLSKKKPTWTITGDQKVVKCQAVITDPPYGITDEPWEPDDLEAFTRDWCGRWSKCGADFFAVFWSQERLFEGRTWFDEALDRYRFQQLLVWHAGNQMAHKSRMCLKQTTQCQRTSSKLLNRPLSIWKPFPAGRRRFTPTC